MDLIPLARAVNSTLAPHERGAFQTHARRRYRWIPTTAVLPDLLVSLAENEVSMEELTFPLWNDDTQAHALSLSIGSAYGFDAETASALVDMAAIALAVRDDLPDVAELAAVEKAARAAAEVLRNDPDLDAITLENESVTNEVAARLQARADESAIEQWFRTSDTDPPTSTAAAALAGLVESVSCPACGDTIDVARLTASGAFLAGDRVEHRCEHCSAAIALRRLYVDILTAQVADAAHVEAEAGRGASAVAALEALATEQALRARLAGLGAANGRSFSTAGRSARSGSSFAEAVTVGGERYKSPALARVEADAAERSSGAR